MKCLGYWIRSLDDSEFFPPQEFVGPMDADVRLVVADYLDRGDERQIYRSHLSCRFCCGYEVVYRKLTDGRWVWPSDLGHYVREHGITLPSDFVEHVRSHPAPLSKSDWDSHEVDVSEWTAWCRANQRDLFAARIREAKLRASADYELECAAEFRRRELEEGVSGEKCQMMGCTRAALVGRAFCAKHLAPVHFDRDKYLWEALRSLP